MSTTKGVSSRAKDVVRDSKSPALLGLGKTESGLSLEQGESVISSKEVPSISVNRLMMGSEGSLSPSSRSLLKLDEIVLTDGFSFVAHILLYLYPFLNTTSKSRPFEYLRLTSLGVIGALVKVLQYADINFYSL
ncbi:uncharacterized protein LOC114270864 [Camellia sinensis]|uniref:uncharacterized protein LOC114270864 n=1 Tax=Camellia sinensis TaxID=4442 RepID=UPI00103660CE|nr:uncharacterized protein LOC114270864 [Camellia sinensis]